MKHLLSILILFSFMSLSFAEDRPLPPLEDFVMQKNSSSYIMKRCVALYEYHALIQAMQKEIQGEEYDNTDEVQNFRDALLLNVYQQVFFPGRGLSEQEKSEMVDAYKNTKSKFINDDNAICGEVLRLAKDLLESNQ